jgi:hypothetical protein
MAGRPTKFNPEVCTKIIEAIKNGATFEKAAEAGGVNYSTILNWKEKGMKANEGVYFEFFQNLKKAEDHGEDQLLQNIINAGKLPQHWQANAWILERRYPHKWGKIDRQEITGKDGGAIVVQQMTDEEVKKRAREILGK